MPDKDYSKGKIYRIWCITGESDDVYVGSTIQSLAKRWGGHKKASRTEKAQHYRLYQKIAGNWDAWKIELIELCPCLSKMELERREGELIRETATLNVVIAGRTQKEWRGDNVEAISMRMKAYYHKNTEVMKKKVKIYYKQNAEAMKEQKKAYYQSNNEAILEYQKTYRQQNADAMKERDKAYYQQNAEAIKEQKKAYRQQNAEAIKERARQRYHKKKAEAQAQTLAT